MKSYTPPMKRPRKALQSMVFSGVKCSRSKLPDGLHQTVGGSDFPVQVADIRLDATLFHLPDSSSLMNSRNDIKSLSGIGTQVHTLRAVIGFQIAVLDYFPFMPPDFTIFLRCKFILESK